ncbi:hypothetical protein SAMN06265348_102242 [Pedobacter westerhofensis]|uniref:Uncharacterized protein n=1 Tax=Pedobacter westerhofensis TaxID=425512 RepID=A0A521BEG2_9SPHI|nr:hypothetical protein [Pedobacter westerhofensis]SMO45497.1 hypothetical protein SAMN06265348_102242 [Pedobacter westerhofensis]
MESPVSTRHVAEAANRRFEREIQRFLRSWVKFNEHLTLLRFDQTMEQYLANDALRDFFLHTTHPIRELLKNRCIARHLGRRVEVVHFDPQSGDPLLAPTEQRIYNLARRMDSEQMHIPFRSVQPDKQTAAGDTADISTYPEGSEEIRYNSGNHFSSRPANNNVFDQNSARCTGKSAANLHILFKRGFLEERLQDIRALTAELGEAGQTELQYFVICSRHSAQEGHFGTSLVIMDPSKPDFPCRVLVCDTLLKVLPQHPRWWNHFVAEYTQVFGEAIAEIVEDLSHPLQKVNIKGDEPYRHDWDCPYYAAAMADALADLLKENTDLMLNGNVAAIHSAMTTVMPDYYRRDDEIKERAEIQTVNRIKRWMSGCYLIRKLVMEDRMRQTFA